MLILAIHHPVDQTANADRSTDRPCALASKSTLDRHPTADPSASSTPNAPQPRPAAITNAKNLVPEAAVSTPGARSSITTRFALARLDTPEIRSRGASGSHHHLPHLSLRSREILACPILADPTASADQMEIVRRAPACQDTPVLLLIAALSALSTPNAPASKLVLLRSAEILALALADSMLSAECRTTFLSAHANKDTQEIHSLSATELLVSSKLIKRKNDFGEIYTLFSNALHFISFEMLPFV